MKVTLVERTDMRRLEDVRSLATAGLTATTVTFAVAASALSLLLAATGVARADGDAARGEKRFDECATCHSLKEGVNGVGPSLHALLGRKAGGLDDFRYSPAISALASPGRRRCSRPSSPTRRRRCPTTACPSPACPTPPTATTSSPISRRPRSSTASRSSTRPLSLPDFGEGRVGRRK
jgi:hypothetical protein